MDSDLNGASPQFTLTCISTGGPATTVTWTRGFIVLTEGTETVLNDPVTAQYTHTLTVTGRHGGLYTCTVANAKPSNDSSNINVQGEFHFFCTTYNTVPITVVSGQPNVSLSVTATSISLSWTSGGSEGVSYEVEWQKDTSVGCSDEDQDNTTITDTSYTISGLEEDSRYTITVTASNTAGSSEVSNSVTAVTEEAGERLSLLVVLVYGPLSHSSICPSLFCDCD